MNYKIFFIILFVFIYGCNKEESINTNPVIIKKETKIEPIKTEITQKSITGNIYISGNINNLNSFGDKPKDIKEIYIKKEEIKNNNSNKSIFDNKSDDDITKFVNNKYHFNNLSYIPLDLVNIKGDYIVDTKGNQLLRKESFLALNELSKAFYQEFNKKLVVVSAYRSYEYQKGIKSRGCSDLFCAKAGYSEHQTGLAVDFFEASSEKEFLSKSNYKIYFEWLKQNAHKYGFHNSYQKGLKIDGYAVEPWHWRYLGIDLATKLYENNQTYAEYLN